YQPYPPPTSGSQSTLTQTPHQVSGLPLTTYPYSYPQSQTQPQTQPQPAYPPQHQTYSQVGYTSSPNQGKPNGTVIAFSHQSSLKLKSPEVDRYRPQPQPQVPDSREDQDNQKHIQQKLHNTTLEDSVESSRYY